MNSNLEELKNFFKKLSVTPTYNELKSDDLCEDSYIVSVSDIEEFDKYVQKHGHTGGWSSSDHSLFLKLTGKHNLQSVIHLLRQFCPDISEEQILKHDTWYKKYQKLKTNQKRALKYWRIQRNEMPKEKYEVEIKTSKSADSNKENVKLQIQQWKEYKKRQQEKKKMIELLAEENRKKQEQIKRINQEYKRQLIQQRRNEMEELNQAFKIANQIEERKLKMKKSKEANNRLHEFREKDKILFQRRRDKFHDAYRQRQEKSEKIEKFISKCRSNLHIERDPSRLLLPTVEWKQKTKPSIEMTEILRSEPVMSIENIPHLCVPNWRKHVLI